MKKIVTFLSLMLLASTAFAITSDIKLTIMDSEKLSLILSDSSDNPPTYLSKNSLVQRSAAINEAKNGSTLCMVRSRFYQPKSSENLPVLSDNSGTQGQLYYRTLAFTDLGGLFQFSLTCISLMGPLSLDDVTENVNSSGIISIIR